MKNGPRGPFFLVSSARSVRLRHHATEATVVAATQVVLHPVADGLGITHAQRTVVGVEQHDDDVAAIDIALHHHAAASFGNVAGFLQADIPVVAVHQTVGVVETARLAGHIKGLAGCVV